MTPSTPRPAAPPLPRTEAGRRLLALLRLADKGPLADTLAVDWAGSIFLIEQEAVRLERERLRAAIEALPVDIGGILDVSPAAVLALLDPAP